LDGKHIGLLHEGIGENEPIRPLVHEKGVAEREESEETAIANLQKNPFLELVEQVLKGVSGRRVGEQVPFPDGVGRRGLACASRPRAKFHPLVMLFKLFLVARRKVGLGEVTISWIRIRAFRLNPNRNRIRIGENLSRHERE
jgi:hypothetical protein